MEDKNSLNNSYPSPPVPGAEAEQPKPEVHLPTSVQQNIAPQRGAVTTRNAIEVRGLTKAFGQTVAVDRINLGIPTGSFYGLVGRNGAGKTTTISMVSGMLQPTEGMAFINGVDMWQAP